MKRFIVGFAHTKDKIMNDLDSHSIPCMKELSKLYLFPHFTEAHIHWSEEIWAHYSGIKRLKSNKKLPKYDFIYQNTWEDNKHLLENAIQKALIEERPIEPDEDRLNDLPTFEEICEEYFSWVAEMLSTVGLIDIPECQSKLRELGLLE